MNEMELENAGIDDGYRDQIAFLFKNLTLNLVNGASVGQENEAKRRFIRGLDLARLARRLAKEEL